MNSTGAHNGGLHGLFITAHGTFRKKKLLISYTRISKFWAKIGALFTPYWVLVYPYRDHLPIWFQLIPVRIGYPSWYQHFLPDPPPTISWHWISMDLPILGTCWFNGSSWNLQEKKSLIIQTSLNFLDIQIKKSSGPYYTTLKRSMTNFDGMSRFLMKNWTGRTY